MRIQTNPFRHPKRESEELDIISRSKRAWKRHHHLHDFFPVISERPARDLKAPDVIPQGTGENLLFVDDEIYIINMTEKALGRFDHNIETTTNPVDALELFRSKPHTLYEIKEKNGLDNRKENVFYRLCCG